jgi:hypothetical protein
MEQQMANYQFNFGPISRTVDASTGKGDAINFASLPIHEMTVALLASENRDEFVAWLWHDLFKPLFWWKLNAQKEQVRWVHCPNNRPNDPLNAEARGLLYQCPIWSGRNPSCKKEGAQFKRMEKQKRSTTSLIRVRLDGRPVFFNSLSWPSQPLTPLCSVRSSPMRLWRW